MKKAIHITYLLCFLLILFIPLCLTNTESDVKSDFDNRTLVELPEFGETEYEDKIESYLQDRIGLRDYIVTGYQLFNNLVAGELTHPIYFYGQDGYMFFNLHGNARYGAYEKTFADAVLKMKNYCESRGAKFYFMFDPEKISVYRRYLPEGVNYNDEWADQLLAYMQELGINCINNKELLIARSYEEQVFNHQYDAGHWNDLGCFYGTNNLWNAIHKDFPSVTEYSKDDFVISTKVAKYLAASKYPVNEMVPDFQLKVGWDDISNQYSEIKRDKNYQFFQYYINTSPEAENYPRMMIFHGSYYNRGPKFFAGRSKEYIGIHDYQNVLNMDYYFNIFQPEVVVFEVAEYTFSDKYFNSEKMAELQYNPSLILTGESVETAIEYAKETAEEYISEEESRLCIIPQEGFDTVYIEKDLPYARYVYVFTDNMIFDMQKDESNHYYTGIPHDAIINNAILYYEDYTGDKYYSYINVQHLLSSKSDECLTITDGVNYNDSTDKYILTTSQEDNAFSAVTMQLYDSMTGAFLRTITTAQTNGTVRGRFTHENESGWYILGLKGSANKKDEGISILTYLEYGKRYYYSFILKQITAKKIEITDYSLYGPDPVSFDNTELIDSVEISGGTERIAPNSYLMKTELEGNRFNSAVLQLHSTEAERSIIALTTVSQAGKIKGKYYHTAADGAYLIILKANSNLKDEFISTYVDLQQGCLYEWSFAVDEMTNSEIDVADFSFRRISSFSK